MMDFNNYVFYSEDSPTFLRWKVDITCGKGQIQHHKGSPAGSQKRRPDKTPHQVVVRIDKKDYAVHRVLWVIFNGEIPDNYVVDHLDRNPWNNNISNLQCKSRSGNQQNKGKNKNNKTGITGVVEYSRENKLMGYAATWVESGKRLIKYFPFRRHGVEAFDLAKQYRKQKITELNLAGESYTTTHGE